MNDNEINNKKMLDNLVGTKNDKEALSTEYNDSIVSVDNSSENVGESTASPIHNEGLERINRLKDIHKEKQSGDSDLEVLNDEEDVVGTSKREAENHPRLPSKTHATTGVAEKVKYYNSYIMYLVIYSLIAVMGIVSRLVKINHSSDGTPIFDEKHYVTQAMQMLFNGGIENNPGYGLVAHPPLGKFLMSIGEALFGYTPMGWRFGSIICGVLITLLLAGIIHRITHSPVLVLLTGIVATIEGTMLVMSRIGMLDIYQVFFITLAAFCAVFYVTSDYEKNKVPWHQRYWMLGVGVASGLAMSIKISGIYYPFVFGVLLVICTFFFNREEVIQEDGSTKKESLFAKSRLWNLTKGTTFGLFSLLIIPICIFLMTYLNWFRYETSWRRHDIISGKSYIEYPDWVVNAFPDSILNFISMYKDMLQFHVGLTTSAGYTHPWESKPWQWLFAEKPMLFMTITAADNQKAEIWLMGNTGLWYFLIPLLIFGFYKIFSKDLAWTIAVFGFIAGFVPWLITHDRQMYFFYATTLAPFLVLMFVLFIRDISSALNKWLFLKRNEENLNGKITLVRIVVSILLITPALFMFYYYIPMYYGIVIDEIRLEDMKLLDIWDMVQDSKESYDINNIGIYKWFKELAS